MSIRSSSLPHSQILRGNSQQLSDVSAESTQDPCPNESKKSPYQVDQQVKFLHLQAEVELLLQQLQSLKQQRIATANYDTGNKLY